MTEFYAQPYSIEHTGFYFDSIEKFETGMENSNKCGCEETEIQFIDGDDHLANLANAANIGQGDVYFWFEELDDPDETAVHQICSLLDLGYKISEVLDRYEDVYIFDGPASDYAHEIIDDTCEVPENLRYNIDYEAIARDMKINGEIAEIGYNMVVTNTHEF